jgi:hypothetical protein
MTDKQAGGTDLKRLEIETLRDSLNEKIAKMELSEIKTRLNEISEILHSNNEAVIDQLVPLHMEAELLVEYSNVALENVTDYISSRAAC